ncbi:TonB-dependent receptor [Ferruginibacter lapsinanis]|uniref:TonB-dependent receptor n=1 Tax=Ferruginibacter lapsinanis TaxID=563172 RepID=UPI001E4D1DD6|nr:TonB-dependent receptor [Ferruginibacter lapsinanis]UEG48685.1 TonB-dependent receptor [Ferruginibacter lapsinanis]
MKKVFISTVLCSFSIILAKAQEKLGDTTFLQPIEVSAVRATEKAPFAKTNLSKKEIEKNNIGQDLPFILNQTPSVVVNSDAGNGVGYTNFRVRGSDATRINITLNGIPYNDPESQISYFVDMPDFVSSASNIQIQRGVGTSSNGAGAFGGSVNISTNEIIEKNYTESNNSYGSFNTWKNTIKFGTGILDKHFTFDARLSKVSSDGYIDRAKSDLKSFYTSTAYVDANKSFRLNIFSGKEKTYQAWNGVPEYLLNTNRTYNSSGTDKPGEPYNNQTDNYTQTHYQFFYNQKICNSLKLSTAVFLVNGSGYWEEYKAGEALADYGLSDYTVGNTTISSTDLIRRLWPNNKQYGTIFSVQHEKKNTQLTIGGGYNQNDAKHFGEVIWAQVPVTPNYHWYDLTATKKDFSLYTKWTQTLNQHWQTFVDVQYRNVDYTINGFRKNPALIVKSNYNFFNPKAGITYNANNWQVFLSYANANKEPNRDDYEINTAKKPVPEKLHDFELGAEKRKTNYSFGATVYYMRYKDQLVLVGNINDVGAYTRINIPKSYRLGVELEGAYVFNKWLNATANLSLSENKIKNFTELIDDYDNGGYVTNFYKKTDISFSPAAIGNYSLNIIPVKNGEISLLGKYVSSQYMDNTSNKSRSLDSYYLQDVRLAYTLHNKLFKETNISLKLNNIFAKKYESTGYTFSYVYGGLTTENFYYPMARFNAMISLNVKL